MLVHFNVPLSAVVPPAVVLKVGLVEPEVPDVVTNSMLLLPSRISLPFKYKCVGTQAAGATADSNP